MKLNKKSEEFLIKPIKINDSWYQTFQRTNDLVKNKIVWRAQHSQYSINDDNSKCFDIKSVGSFILIKKEHTKVLDDLYNKYLREKKLTNILKK